MQVPISFYHHWSRLLPESSRHFIPLSITEDEEDAECEREECCGGACSGESE